MKNAQTEIFPYFTKEFIAVLMELCGLTLTNAFHFSILQVAYQFLRLCFMQGTWTRCRTDGRRQPSC